AAADRRLHQVVAQARLRVLDEELRGEPHVARRDGVAVAYERAELLEDLRDPGRALLVAFDEQVLPLALDADLERVLEEAEVVVVRAEEGLHAPFRNGNLAHEWVSGRCDGAWAGDEGKGPSSLLELSTRHAVASGWPRTR